MKLIESIKFKKLNTKKTYFATFLVFLLFVTSIVSFAFLTLMSVACAGASLIDKYEFKDSKDGKIIKNELITEKVENSKEVAEVIKEKAFEKGIIGLKKNQIKDPRYEVKVASVDIGWNWLQSPEHDIGIITSLNFAISFMVKDNKKDQQIGHIISQNLNINCQFNDDEITYERNKYDFKDYDGKIIKSLWNNYLASQKEDVVCQKEDVEKIIKENVLVANIVGLKEHETKDERYTLKVKSTEVNWRYAPPEEVYYYNVITKLVFDVYFETLDKQIIPIASIKGRNLGIIIHFDKKSKPFQDYKIVSVLTWHLKFFENPHPFMNWLIIFVPVTMSTSEIDYWLMQDKREKGHTIYWTYVNYYGYYSSYFVRKLRREHSTIAHNKEFLHQVIYACYFGEAEGRMDVNSINWAMGGVEFEAWEYANDWRNYQLIRCTNSAGPIRTWTHSVVFFDKNATYQQINDYITKGPSARSTATWERIVLPEWEE